MKKRNKIVIIGASYLQLPLLRKAKALGFETHVFAWAQDAVGIDEADYFYPISIRDIPAIIDQCRQIRPQAVVSIASDLANITVNQVAQALHLPSNSAHCLKISTDKFLMRQALRAAGVPCPQFVLVDRNTESLKLVADLKFPLIVKPVDRSGSRGVTKITTQSELAAAVAQAQAESFSGQAIVEEFIDGPEYSAEFIAFAGDYTLLNITAKYTTGYPHFIETGHLEPAPLAADVVERINVTLKQALTALEITTGAVHAEFKLNQDQDVRIIEIASRMGGDHIGAKLVPLSTGQDFVQMVIETALGQKPTLTPRQDRIVGIKFIIQPSDLTQVQRWEAAHPGKIIEQDLAHLDFDTPVDSSATRKGWVLFTADQYEDAVMLLAEGGK